MDKNKIGKSRKALKVYKKTLHSLTNLQMEIIIGLLLGDVNLQTQDNGKTYRLKFEQSDIHKNYLFHLFDIFNEWVLSSPKLCVRKNIHNRIVKTWRFQTFSHEVFTPLAKAFLNENNQKKIPISLIQLYFTKVSLAYWFMDDGGKLDYNENGSKGIVLNTQGFSFVEVNFLSSFLVRKFALKCWVKKNKQKPIIAISGFSYDQICSLIEPFIISSMKYKLPSKRKK